MAIRTYPLRLLFDFYLELRDCYCVPAPSRNLISILSLAKYGYKISFKKDYCAIYFRNKLVGYGHLINSLYYLHVDANKLVNQSKQTVNVIGSKRSRDEVNLMYMSHFRLDHIGEERINRLEKDGLLDSFLDESFSVCESCLQRKIIKLSFVGYGEKDH